MHKTSPQRACLSLSGGMDSSSLLIHLLAKNCQVTAISFLYGQKNAIEVNYAQKLVTYLQEKGYALDYHIIEFNGLDKLLFSALINEDSPLPEGHYQQDNMRLTVVPNRNKLFLSVLQSIALSLHLKSKTKILIALGIHAGDDHTYPDCRPAFIEQDYQAFLSGNWDAEAVQNYMPYQYFSKFDVLVDGEKSCQQLGLDFNEIYSRTMTSYHPNKSGISDYKTSASLQRIEAFIRLNRPDPILYADDTGIVTWETVIEHAKQILQLPI